jgi:hypothetical protein
VFGSSVNLVLSMSRSRPERCGRREPHRRRFRTAEDGVRQQIVTFAFEEITTNATAVAGTYAHAGGGEDGAPGAAAATRGQPDGRTPAAPLTSEVPPAIASDALSTPVPCSPRTSRRSTRDQMVDETDAADLVAVASIIRASRSSPTSTAARDVRFG